MYVYVCVCACVCVCVCVCVWVRACVHACIHVYMHVWSTFLSKEISVIKIDVCVYVHRYNCVTCVMPLAAVCGSKLVIITGYNDSG